MPRPPSDVWMHFTSASAEGKTVYICRYCAKPYVKNATKMQQHITKCRKSLQGSNQATTVIQPQRKQENNDHITESVRDEAPHVQLESECEERLRREARDDQKEDRANLLAMWKEMMEFQGNLLKEFIHHPSLSASVPYHKHTQYTQRSSSVPSTSYTAPYDSPGLETEYESTISQEEKYGNISSGTPPTSDALAVNCANDSQSNVTLALSPPPTQSSEKTDLQMSVLRRQEKVLQLQEKYYTLKIKYLKDKMSTGAGHDDKESKLFS